MALGSAPTEVLGMVMREVMTDALAIMGTVPTLLMVAAVASFIPARRAATVDPLITMRAN